MVVFIFQRKVVDFVIEQYFQDLAKNAKKYLVRIAV